MLMGLPELLRGKTAWYKNCNQKWSNWAIKSLKKNFLPREYHAKLDDEIRARIQRPEEPYAEYAIGTLL